LKVMSVMFENESTLFNPELRESRGLPRGGWLTPNAVR
jgi:hypothetical protein